MRAYQIERFGSFDGIVMRERAMPQPGRHDLLVRVAASSLNFRDIAIAKGFYGARSFDPGFIPLSDGAGEIVALGAEVRGWTVGERVAGLFRQNWQGGRMPARAAEADLGGSLDGMLTEYALLSQEGAVRVPAHFSYAEAATLPCAALTAWHALHAGEPMGTGETILALGSGGVSVFALQFAKLLGGRVIAVSSSDEKLARLRALGADELINYSTTPDWDREVLRLTDGRGVARVIEVGGAGTLARSMRSAEVGGRVIVIGVLTGNAQIDPNPILGRRLTLQAISTGSREMFEAMNLAIGQAQMRPVIDRTFPFEAAREAYAYLESARHIGKVVIQHG